MTSLSWLHLTDLHLGMAAQHSLLPAIKDRFFEDLKALHEKSGPWDLVLFTGDLTQKGSVEEFKRVDEFLGQMWQELTRLGSKPSLLAIPGNHDLVRPNAKLPEVKLLRSNWLTEEDVQTEFWSDAKSPYRTTVDAAFKNFVDWWANTPLKLPVQSGLLPGDFSATLEKDGVSFGIVGLNSTFLQLTDGDYKGRLAVHPDQFQSVCQGDGPAWVKRHAACLLLTHQPPDWLTPASREHLRSEIAGYNFFAVHLFGHMHEARYVSEKVGGASTLRAFQGTSVFGLEYFGEEKGGQREDRRHGYASGRIELHGKNGSLIYWPRQAYQPGGQWHFAADVNDFVLEDDQTLPEAFPLLNPIELQEPAPAPDIEPVRPVPRVVESPFPNQWAVLVGVNNYPDLTKLNYCRQDVIDLANAFRESLGFQNVFEFHEESALKPERDAIFRKLGDIRDSGKVRPDDLFVFYFSGHGISEGGRDYLLPIGARPRDVKALGIRVQDLAESLREIGCRNTAMIIDACREAVQGAKGTTSIGEESKNVIATAGIVAFFSCDPKDRSYEIESLQHGSFTYCVLQAIKEGSATTVSELDKYLRENVPQINSKYNKPTQQPYAVVEPPERGTLEILFNPLQRQKVLQRFEPLVDYLLTLLDADKDVLPALEFLGQVKTKKQLDESEKLKVSVIESLCEGRLSLDIFLRTWERRQSSRRDTPQIKRPPRLH